MHASVWPAINETTATFVPQLYKLFLCVKFIRLLLAGWTLAADEKKTDDNKRRPPVKGTTAREKTTMGVAVLRTKQTETRHASIKMRDTRGREGHR